MQQITLTSKLKEALAEATEIDAISKYTGHSQGKIKSMLFRTRQKLRKYLESEGVSL